MDRPRDHRLATQVFGASPAGTLALVRAAWVTAVGPELARRTEVVSIDGGMLRVRVPDMSWQRNLWRMRSDILARLRRVAGGLAPRAIGFVQGEIAAPAATPPAPAPVPAVPREPTPPSTALVEASRAIEDEALRAAFLAVARRYLGRFPPNATGG
jgi:hypothetical protein